MSCSAVAINNKSAENDKIAKASHNTDHLHNYVCQNCECLKPGQRKHTTASRNSSWLKTHKGQWAKPVNKRFKK